MLEPGRSLKTGPNAYVRLRYPDGSTVDLNAAGELALLNGTRAKRLQLVTGTAYFESRRSPPPRRWSSIPGNTIRCRSWAPAFR